MVQTKIPENSCINLKEDPQTFLPNHEFLVKVKDMFKDF